MANGMATVFTDASFCPKTRAAGWGAWVINSELQRGLVFGGPIPDKRITSADHAELQAMRFGLMRVKAAGHLDGHVAVMLQSDSVTALQVVLRGYRNAMWTAGKGHKDVKRLNGTSLDGKLVHEAMIDIKHVLAGRALWLRHVKGHGDSETGRSWVNNVCDAEAKQHMRILRATYYGESENV